MLLSPYTAHEVLTLAQRDHDRSLTNLANRERANRALPPATRASSEAEYLKRDADADRKVRRWLSDGRVMTIAKDVPALFPPTVPYQDQLDWWHETLFRDSTVNKLHEGIPGHWYDELVSLRNPRPIRATYWRTIRIRPEGLGFYAEELMLNSGVLDDQPRAKEVFDLWQVFRYQRMVADIRMASGELTPQQVVDFLRATVPLMREGDDTAWMEASGYFRSPTTSTLYVLGRYQIERLLARLRAKLGDTFDMREFHDRMMDAGAIPPSLISWELTGSDDELKKLRLGAPTPSSAAAAR